MNRLIDINELHAVCRDLEAVHALLRQTWATPPDDDDRLGYLLERLEEHIAALRRLIDPEHQP